ncbi:MAG TPA: hypothetical protein VHW96_06885 [Solirubrobacteraceae bacterium]|jgi:hypothetical protein|nr:hypothetical protein [Solirubrobacteraceae bacterium]
MLAIGEIWGNFRDDRGNRHFGAQAVSGELGVVQRVLEYGQDQGIPGSFDARVMAVSIKVRSRRVADPACGRSRA